MYVACCRDMPSNAFATNCILTSVCDRVPIMLFGSEFAIEQKHNNRYKSKWIFHRLDQRDPVDLLLKDHEVKVWLKRRVFIKRLINNARLTILHHSLCYIIHIRPIKDKFVEFFSLDDSLMGLVC